MISRGNVHKCSPDLSITLPGFRHQAIFARTSVDVPPLAQVTLVLQKLLSINQPFIIYILQCRYIFHYLMIYDSQIILTYTPAYCAGGVQLMGESDRYIKNVCTIICPQNKTCSRLTKKL